MNPASVYSRWLDALGLHDLARRATWELASDPSGIIGQALEMGRADPAGVRPLRKPVQKKSTRVVFANALGDGQLRGHPRGAPRFILLPTCES
jgi:hypothetical protein